MSTNTEPEDTNVPVPTPAVTTEPQIGFCHVCDRQVPLNQEEFTCSVCNGGFIELFETPPAAPAAQNPNPLQQMFATGMPADGNLMSLLPLLLPQLLGQMGGQMGPGGQQPHINIRAGVQGQGQQQAGGVVPGQPRQSATRLQFIVPNSEPGGQVDLYGIINNVLSDLLTRPGATTTTNIPQQNAQFHFQPPPIRMFQLHGDMRDYAWGEGGLDTIITQLLNQLTNTGPPPATEEQVINLPLVKINEEEFEKKVECSICMEDFRLHEEAKKLPCKHYFHEPCITEWLKLHGTCPVCRKDLTGEDTSQREYISRAPPPGSEDAERAMDADNNTPETTTPATNPINPNSASDNSTITQANEPTNEPHVYHDMDFD